MLATDEPDRKKDQDQKKFSISDGPVHSDSYPFIQEFSDLLAELSTKELYNLLTNQQKRLAKAFWEAENFGGCPEKCKKRLTEIYGPHWTKQVKFRDYFKTIDGYYIYVLLIDHKRQWDKHRKVSYAVNQVKDPE